MAYILKQVIIRNKLDDNIKNVKVLYAQSDKNTNVLAYAFDWSTVNVETEAHVLSKKEVLVGDVDRGREVQVECVIPFTFTRGYWQVYFRYKNSLYKINKNNAMVNPWSQDDEKYVEITVRFEGEKIRLDFSLDSGNAYFYATDYGL